MMTVGKKETETGETQFWLRWVAAHGFPAAVSFPLIYLSIYATPTTPYAFRDNVGNAQLLTFIFGLGPPVIIISSSFLLGVFQQAVLRQRLKGLTGLWWVTTGVGLVVGMLLAALLYGGRTTANLLCPRFGPWFVAGAGMGAVQAWMLREYIKRPGWWITANSIGIAILLRVYLLFGEVIEAYTQPWRYAVYSEIPYEGREEIIMTAAMGAIVGLLVGTVLGLISGVVLARLLKRPVLEEEATRICGE